MACEIQQGQFIRLNDNNWNVWKFQIKVTLIAKELFDVVNGSTPKPEVGNAEEQKAFNIKDAKAQEILVSRMEQGPLSHIISCGSSSEMWTKLHAIYERQSNVSVHLLQQQFFNMKFEDNVMNFLSKIQNLIATIKQQSNEIPENMVITKVIMSLPEQYKHFISAWESVADDQRTLSNLTARLLIEEERLKSNEKTVALTANDRGQSNIKCFSCGKPGHKKSQCKRIPPKVNKTVVCNFCQKKGHMSRDCWFRQRKLPKNAGENSVALMGTTEEQEVMKWYLDSGASEHMCNKYEMFGKYVKLKEPKQIKIGDGSLITAIGIGTVFIESYNGCKFVKMKIQNVLHVPELELNLLSQGKVLDKGFYMISDAESAKFIHLKTNVVYAVAKRENKLFRMMFRLDKTTSEIEKEKFQSDCHVASSSKLKNKSLLWWHERLAHQHFNHVKKVLKENEITWESSPETPFCEACIQGKQHRGSFPESKSKSTEICNLIHSDLCGPMEVSSIGGSRYMLVLKDDFSHYRQVYFLEYKHQVHEKLSQFIMFCKNQKGKNIKILRTDNGKEYDNSKVKELLNRHGIEHQTIVPYNPEQNGRAERENRTIIEAVRTMMAAKNLDKKFWAEAANTAVYIINRSGTSTINGKTPYQLWNSKEFDLKNLKIPFGAEVWFHIPKEKRKKLDVKSEKGIFVGYGETTKGFRIFNPKKNAVTLERDVISIPNETTASPKENETIYVENLCSDSTIQESAQGGVDPVIQETSSDVDRDVNKTSDDQNFKIKLRPRDQLQRPSKYDDFETSFLSVTDCEEPMTFEEALQSNFSDEWQKAMELELKALNDNNTWDIIDKPKNCDVIDSKWVFKIKRDGTGKITNFKARLVARGFQQKDLIYEDIYSPVAKLNTFRILLAICVNLDWVIFQMDVCSAFLHGEIKENIFMYLPDNCNLPEGKVCQLKKAIYGLKRAPKYWNEKFHEFMSTQNFIKSENDHCLYFRITDQFKIYVLIYVDDLIITGSNVKEIDNLKVEMMKNFKMKDLGLISYYLGISVNQNLLENTVTLSQSNYLENVLKRFDMYECKNVSTPMDNNFNYDDLLKEKSESLEIENKCRKLIGCIMYAMLGSRPDLCNSISILSRYQNYASNDLLLCLKRVLRYIKGTIDLKLVYKKNLNSELIKGFVDADWGGDTITRKSTTGYCFQIFDCTVSWCSKQQSCVALSSTEAEYIALSQCVSEACWFKNLLIELNILNDKNESVLLYEDNQSAIRVSKSCEQPKRLKHINIKYHFIQEKVRDGVVKIMYLPSNKQIADILTKPLGKIMFEKFKNLIFGINWYSYM